MNDPSLLWLRLARRFPATLDEMVERPHHQEVHGGTQAGDAQLRREGMHKLAYLAGYGMVPPQVHHTYRYRVTHLVGKNLLLTNRC